jgi:hypothetical protein
MKDCKDLMESAKNDDGSCIQWLNFFPEYGCLVVAHSHDQHSLVGTVRVKVLGLDAYEFGLHPRTEDRTYDHVSHAGKFKPIDVGTLHSSDLDRFKTRLFQILSTARTQCGGDGRSASGGKQGHQYTPAFIHAIARQAKTCPCAIKKECNCTKVVPKGAFTDNGRHTGGEPRNTSFPLVRSFLQWCMKQSHDVDGTVFQRFLVFLDLYIVHEWLAQLRGTTDGDDSLFSQDDEIDEQRQGDQANELFFFASGTSPYKA